jgi:glycosyltransferase involved in cell wall biosynthesis
MKVSVLIPTYNSERHLAECLDSVLAQDYSDMEILISDDCSTDNTRQVIKLYAARDPRIRWWENPVNLGLIGNHNACLQAATGDYIKFVQADDRLLSVSAVKKMAAALDENASVVLVGARQHFTGGKRQPAGFPGQTGVYNGRWLIIASLEQNTNYVGQPTLAMFRRSAARRGFDDRFVGHLDYEMWCHLLEQGDFAYLDEVLATWRVHESQQTARHQNSGLAQDERLLFMELYYAKPWLKAAATPRMLFAQIYYLRKKYGRRAASLTTAMMAQLSSPRFAWEWFKHKAFHPVRKVVGRTRR